jgi:hypothetical protein
MAFQSLLVFFSIFADWSFVCHILQKNPKVKAVTRRSKFVTSYATWQSAIGPGCTSVSYKFQSSQAKSPITIHSVTTQQKHLSLFSLSIPQIKHHKNHKKFSRIFKNTLEYSSNYHNQIIIINHTKKPIQAHTTLQCKSKDEFTQYNACIKQKTDPSAINHKIATSLQGSQRFGTNRHHRT